MSLMLCPNCDTYYQEPEEFFKFISEECKRNGIGVAVIKCICGERNVSGGEREVFAELEGINLFSRKFTEEDVVINEFPALMLEECKEGDPAIVASTISGNIFDPISPKRTIFLRPDLSRLFQGLIPAFTVCPFVKECELADDCKHLGKDHKVNYSCAVARGFDMCKIHQRQLKENKK